MRRIHQIAACLMSLVLVALLLEAGLRLLGFSPRPTMNRFDALLGWVKAPSTSIRRHTSEFDVRLETNSRGLREDESIGYVKPPGLARILMVGDSFTLGYTVDGPDTLTQLLQGALRAEGRNVEVINGGTEGYSTDQEVIWLAVEGAKYAPDIVVLQMYENDIFWNGQDRYLRYPKPHLSPEKPPDAALDALPRLIDPGREPWLQRSTALGTLVGGLLAPPAMPLLPGARPLPAEWEARLHDDASGWAETRAALRAFRVAADRIGARPLVLVIPDKAQIDPAARRVIEEAIGDPAYDARRPYRGMLAAASAAGLPVVDPEGAMVAAAEGGRRSLYFARDWHTNALGNRIVVDQLVAALAQPTLLGPPHREDGARPALPPRVVAESPRTLRGVGIAVALWLALATLYRLRFPGEGAVKSYAAVAALIGFVALTLGALDWGIGHLPLWLSRWVATAVAVGTLGAILWYLRARLPVMGELFGSFVRRGQWVLLPVLVGLLSLGALLVVAASSPWLAPFIYTLF